MKITVTVRKLTALLLTAGILGGLGPFSPKTSAVEGEPIPIVMALDDGYLYQAVVAMTSMLEVASEGTFYKIFIMVPGDFKPVSRSKLQFLQEKYSNCNVVFIDMGHRCEEWNLGGTHTPTFYRLMLDLIPDSDVDMCFYTDPDIIIAQDLKGCMEIDLGESWCAAVPDPFARWRENDCSFMVGIESKDDYVLAGNFVVSLKKWRELNLTQRFAQFMNERRGKVNDMTALNAVCHGHFKRLPVKYCMMPCMVDVKSDANMKARTVFTDAEIEEALQTPLVIHYASFRPWVEPSNVIFSDRWWQYAHKSHCWPEIKAKFIESLRKDEDKRYVFDCLPVGAIGPQKIPVIDFPKFEFDLCPGANIKDLATRSWWLAARSSGRWSEVQSRHLSKLPNKAKINILYFLQKQVAA